MAADDRQERCEMSRYRFMTDQSSRWIGPIISIVGVVVVAGWILRISSIVRIGSGYEPMPVTAALGFVFTGLALFALEYGRKQWARRIAVGLGVFSALVLLEYQLGIDLGIDRPFGEPFIATRAPVPGRMAPNTALCFAFVALASFALTTARGTARSAFLAGGLASLVCAIGLTSLIGYAARLNAAYAWSGMPGMALLSSLLFLAVAYSLGTAVARVERIWVDVPMRWLSGAIMLGALVTSVIVWIALDAREQDSLSRVLAARAQEVGSRLKRGLRGSVGELKRVALRWELHGGLSRDEWESDVAGLLATHPEYQAVEWVDAGHVVRWVTPLEGNEPAVDLVLDFEAQRQRALERSRDSKKPHFAGPVDLVQGGRGLVVSVPLFIEGRFDGFVVGVYRTHVLFGTLLPRDHLGFETTVYLEEEDVFRSRRRSDGATDHRTAASAKHRIKYRNLAPSVVIAASPNSPVPGRSILPEVVLVAGCLAGLLGGGLAHMVGRTRERAEELDRATKTLRFEIRERERANEAHIASERRWRQTFEWFPYMACLLDRDGVYLDWNRAAESVMGFGRDEVIGRRFLDFSAVRDDCVEHAVRDWERALRYERTGPTQLVVRRKDGIYVTIEQSSVALEVDGIPVILGVALDVSERKALLEALHEREQRFRRVFEDGPVAIALLDLSGNIESANPKLAELSGYSLEDLRGMFIGRLADSESQSALIDALERAARAGEDTVRMRFPGIVKSGRQLPFAATMSALRDDSGRSLYVLVMLEDDSESWQTDVERDRLYRLSLDIMCITDMDGLVVDVNPRYMEVLGYEKSEVVGKPCFGLIEASDVHVAEAAFDALRRGEAVPDTEVRMFAEDGSTKWLGWAGLPVVEEQVVYWTARDRTERRRVDAELSQHRNEVAHALRVLTLGQMAAQVCHEVNQPIGAIVNYASTVENLMRLRGMEDEGVLALVRKIAEQGHRAGDLLHGVRAFVGQRNAQRETVDLNDVISRAVRLVGEAGRDVVKIVENLAPGLPPVFCDPGQIEQVVVNLLQNAVDASSGGARPVPEVRIETARSGGNVEIRVTDHGSGIKEADLERVFDSFHTSKPNGLGLGLAITRSIVESHGGRVYAESAPGRGSTFHVLLPVRSDPDATA